jgi:hypothetical protein
VLNISVNDEEIIKEKLGNCCEVEIYKIMNVPVVSLPIKMGCVLISHIFLFEQDFTKTF